MSSETRSFMIASIPIRSVWDRLGGGPLRNGRASAFWRRSDSANISLDCERNIWWDFARSDGGGILKLVRTVRECDQRNAVRWLRAQGFIQDRATSPEGRRRQARRRTGTERVALDIKYWRLARIAKLEKVKAAAIRRADDVALSASASELHRLQSDGAAVVDLYEADVRRNPNLAAARIAWARADERHAKAVTARMVLLLDASEVPA